jgi:DNA-binding transcriptional ArsR family regulator
MSDKTLELVAERFRVLGDRVRLRLLQALESGEQSVADLAAATGAGQANVSKHLQLMLRAGVVQRRREGLFVFYSVRDPRVFQLCDVVCGSLAEHFTRELSELAGGESSRSARRTGARSRTLRRR